MTANHDTPEAVGALADQLEPLNDDDVCQHCEEYRFPALPDAAAMLRRLHKRAVDAERERDEAARLRDAYRSNEATVITENDGLRFRLNNLSASLVTARADALREAADRMFKAASDAIAHVGHSNTASRQGKARRMMQDTYTEIVNKEPRHD